MKKLSGSLILLVLLTSTASFSDGLSVRKWLSIKDVVQRSDYIFTATVLKADHIWGKRKAYGRINRYVQKYRFRVKIDKLIYKRKSQRNFKQIITKEVWLGRGSIYIPGKWILVPEMYRETYNLYKGKKGDRIIVYAKYYMHSKNLSILYIDKFNMFKKLSAVVKKMGK